MDKKRHIISQKILLFLIKPLAHVWLFFDFKKTIRFNDFNHKRKDAYLLLGNHTFFLDVAHIPLRLKKVPYVVASEELFVRQPTKFLFTWIARAIPKRKAASDLRTAKMIIKAIRNDYPVMILPEGDTTYFGETKNIEDSTYKLIKKLKVDVVTCNVKGGYLSRPRWATGKRRKRHALLNYNVTIKKEELKNLSTDQIKEIIEKALYNNDFEYQRKAMIKHPGKELAEGIENVLYVCPVCSGINTLESNGNNFRCKSCKTEGSINEYGFIEGFKYDNLIDWDNFQRAKDVELKSATIESTALLYFVTFKNSLKELQGKVKITYKDHHFIISGAHNEKVPIDKVNTPKISLRRDLSFIYNEKYYLFKLDNYATSLLRVMQDKY